MQLNNEAMQNMRNENQASRLVHIKAKFGNDTTKTNMGTASYGRSFGADDFDKGKLIVTFTLDPLYPVPHILEWYTEGKSNGVNPNVSVKINGIEVDTSPAPKDGGSFHKSKGLIQFTPEEGIDVYTGVPVNFELDLTRPGNSKVKMKQGAILVYAIDEYVPPPFPVDPVLPID